MNIGLVAHDSKKTLMQNFCIAYRGILSLCYRYNWKTHRRGNESECSQISSWSTWWKGTARSSDCSE